MGRRRRRRKIRLGENSRQFRISNLPNSELESVLPDGYTIETSPAAENWWREAAGRFGSAENWWRLITASPATNSFRPPHTTARCAPISGITSATISGKCRRTGIDRARQFFRDSKGRRRSRAENGIFCHAGKISDANSGKTLEGQNLSANGTPRTRQFQTLTHPEHLGRAFRVLIQSRCSS